MNNEKMPDNINKFFLLPAPARVFWNYPKWDADDVKKLK